MIDVTVERSKWARGGINGTSRLLNSDGNMCCLGFLGITCGYSAYDLRRIGDPQECFDRYAPSVCKWPKSILDSVTEGALHKQNTDYCTSLMVTNDNLHISDELREEKIIETGKEAGVNFTFVD